MTSVPNEPHPLAPTPTPPPPAPELPPYAPVDPYETPIRPDLGLPPPYASVVQETYTNSGFQGEGHSQSQCQGHPLSQGHSQCQPQYHVHSHRGPPFHLCHYHNHHQGSQQCSGMGRLEVMHELDVDNGLSTSFQQYNQCPFNGMAPPLQYPQHVTIIRDSQVAAPINTNCLVGFSAFVLCCCCVPFGMAAMIKALEVRSRLRTGDIAGARTAASSSRMWSGAGLLIGAMFQLSVLVYIMYI